jgi:hypothetical protein
MDSSYIQFWNWFVQNKIIFEGSEISDAAIELIDQQINLLGDFAWEIGPGHTKVWSLTISPGGEKELLATTRNIISQAPILTHWEFHYAKPVKEWDNYFDVVIGEEKQGIDISSWEYVLFRNEAGSYDIQIRPDGIPAGLKLNEKELYGVVEMVLDSIIGEEKRLEIIDHLEVVGEFAAGAKKSKTRIVHLWDHLKNS